MNHPFVRSALLGATAALAMVATASQAQAQDPFGDVLAKPVQPIVLLAIDTSGSMEFVQSVDEVPNCLDINDPDPTNTDPRVFAKPRHVQAKEVMTGRFEDYFCREEPRSNAPTFDDGYPVPHFEPFFSRRVADTGLVYLNRDLVRFGFAAFDTEPASDSFSFPNPVQPPENNVWNIGIRGPNASHSPLVPVGDLFNPVVGRVNAQKIEDAILNFIPFGSTPLAALFRDLNTYLTNDPNIQNDPFKSCRSIDIIVVTDGQPSFDQCAAGEDGSGDPECANYPYQTTLEEIVKLRVEHGVNVHVVGFNIDPEERGPCRGQSRVQGMKGGLQCVHQMALAGGTDANDDGDDRDLDDNNDGVNDNEDDVYAFVADNQLALTRELTKAINRIVQGTSARTKTSTTRRIALEKRRKNAGTYQVSAAFNLDPTFHLWEGVIERQEFLCVGGNLTIPDPIDFSVAINTRSADSRNIFTAFVDKAKINLPINAGLVEQGGKRLIRLNQDANDLNAIISLDDRNRIFEAGVLPQTQFNDIVDIAEGTIVVDGETRRRSLGDIFHSDPAIVGGPELFIDIPGYKRFADFVNPVDAPRKTMLYVGANDGQLHAFDLESDDGDELFAFIPVELQDRLYLQRATHIFGVDGSPKVVDTRLFRGANKPLDVVDPVDDPNIDSLDPSNFHDIWDTVLVVGGRSGGRFFSALSVADPTAPRFLWELNPEFEERRLKDSNEPFHGSSVDLVPNEPLIGLTYGQPALGTVVLFDDEGNRFERGVTVLTAGLPTDVSNPGNLGKAVFVVDTATGQIIRRFTTLNNNPNTPIRSAISGSVAAHNDFPGKILTRAFAGDSKGRIIRVDMSDTDPNEWYVEEFFDMYADDGFAENDPRRRPVFIQPAVATDRSNQIVILAGTGDVDDLENRTGTNYMYSITEEVVFDDNNVFIESFKATENWRIEFANGEKLTGAPIIFDSIAYFPTFVPNPTPCETGNGRVYAVDFNQVDEDGKIIGKHDNGDDQFDDNNGPDLGLSSDNVFFDLPAGNTVFGLEIASQPVCVPEVPDDLDGDTGTQQVQVDENTGQDNLELIIQTGAGKAQPPRQGQRINSLRFKLRRPVSSIFPVSWAAMLD